MPLPSGSTLLALRSWFWLPHRDMENMSIPGIHCGNGDPTLAVRCTQGKLPETWGQLQHRVPQAVWSPLLRPSAPGCGLAGLNLSFSTENIRLPPASSQLPGESFSHQRGPKSLLGVGWRGLIHVHTLSPVRWGTCPPKRPKVCMHVPLELCNGEAPLSVPHFPGSL